jgi:uncharacterized protein with NRDE domain
MCLILVSVNNHSQYSLILAGNRDEFLDRPTASAHFWEDAPNILAGRDLRESGTWLGISTSGELAVLTNFRNPSGRKQNALSRGNLVSEFLRNECNPSKYAERLADDVHNYNEFNLLFGHRSQLRFLSNRETKPRILEPGVYGLSNHLLDTPWPKLVRGKMALQETLSKGENLDPEVLFEILTDRTQPPDESLPETGVGLEWERILAPIFVSSDSYGTRSSVVLLIDLENKVTFWERTYDNCNPHRFEEKRFEFSIRNSFEKR